METTINLYQKLWAASDDLRSQMDANEYKNYLLGIIFYKYLSDNKLAKVGELLELDSQNLFEIQAEFEAAADTEDYDLLKGEFTNDISYLIEHQFT